VWLDAVLVPSGSVTVMEVLGKVKLLLACEVMKWLDAPVSRMHQC
jgi:hypothetical protein